MTIKFSDGQVIADEIPVHPVGARWYLPLGELLGDLGIVVEIQPEEGTASGTFLSENRKFSLSLRVCRVTGVDRNAESYPCDFAVVHDDDIYVATDLLQKEFPLKIDVNSLRSEVVVDSPEPLERFQHGKRRKRQGRYDPGYPRLEIPAENIDGFFLNQQLSYVSQSAPDRPPTEFRHDSLVSGEFLGMETSLWMNGHEEKIDRQRLTLSKHSIDGELLGPARAREIQLMDVTFPTLPLIGGSGLFRGALISSYPLQGMAPASSMGGFAPVTSSSQYGIKDFIGDLPAGWDVELYQNDVLIDRRSSNSGRYEFLNIPLNFGENRFRRVFHGPQGQKREEFETYSIDSSFLHPGEQAYRVAVADDFGLDARWLVQYDRGLAKNFNLSAAATRFSPNIALQPPVAYGLLGVRAYVSDILLGGSAAASEGGGLAFDNSVQVPFRATSIGVGYTHLANYVSDIFKPDPVHFMPQDVYRANVTFNLFTTQTVRVQFEGSRTIYQDQYSKDLLTNRMSTVTGPIKWFNTVNYDQSAAIEMNGELTMQTNLGPSETRLITNYDAVQFNKATLDFRYKYSEALNIGLGWAQTFALNLNQALANVTRQFERFALTANAGVDNQGGYSVGALLSYGLEREPRTGAYVAQPRQYAAQGAASIFVFNDLNQNGQQDSGEPPLEGVEIVLNQQDTGVKTDKNGIAIMGGLRIEEPADLTLSLASLPSEQMQIFPKGFRIYPRTGKMARIDFSVAPLNEIAGLVRVRGSGDKSIAKRGIRMRLLDGRGDFVRSVVTDSDGFYLFEDLPAGDYILDIDPLQLKGLKYKGDNVERKIHIGPNGLIDDKQDFLLEPAAGKR